MKKRDAKIKALIEIINNQEQMFEHYKKSETETARFFTERMQVYEKILGEYGEKMKRLEEALERLEAEKTKKISIDMNFPDYSCLFSEVKDGIDKLRGRKNDVTESV